MFYTSRGRVMDNVEVKPTDMLYMRAYMRMLGYKQEFIEQKVQEAMKEGAPSNSLLKGPLTGRWLYKDELAFASVEIRFNAVLHELQEELGVC